ncbi:MAG: lipopolysaccharide heptosyltransferase I [Burkholderiales bacterium]|nr:MAG: lipopolysaccharide heptosyltransferase I [Burkholderiales bacterium]
MDTSGERFLIVKTSSMGDVVHALPLATDLARRWPSAPIDWLVEESFAAIPRMHRSIDRVITVAVRRWRRAPAAAQTWRELRAAKQQLRAQRYSAIVDCQGLLKSAWMARWARGTRWGFDRASAREPLAALLYTNVVAVAREQHAIVRNRALGRAACGTDVTAPASFGLQPPAIAGSPWADATSRPFAVLLTNASRASKRWPDERWRDVAQALHGRGLRALLFAGSAAEEADTRARAAGMADAWVAPRCGLDTVAAALARARVVVGLDTGLSHLAAALGAPTVGIFCDYDPRLVGITGPAPCASLGGVNAAPTAEAVVAAVDQLLGSGAAAPRLP